MVRGLEEPQLGWPFRPEQLHHPPMVLVCVGQIRTAPPLSVAGHRQRHLLAVEGHPEDLGVLHRGVDFEDMHRRHPRRSAPRACEQTPARRGSSASSCDDGGGTGLVCSQPRRQRNCGSSDSMSASAVVPVRGSPLMSIGPLMVTSSTSGCCAYQASTSRRLTSLRRRSPITAVVGVAMQVAIAFEAVEKYLQARRGSRQDRSPRGRFRNCLLQQPISGRIAQRLSAPSRDRDSGARPWHEIRPASPRCTVL